MLLDVKELNRLTVAAEDGVIGHVKDLYFDDERWVIRYLVVATGGWLNGRDVLISPMSVTGIQWPDETVKIRLTRKQVMDSPNIDTEKRLSRQHELDLYNHYGYANYWEGTNLWGLAAYPIPWVGASPDAMLIPGQVPDEVIARGREELLDVEHDTADAHVRSSGQLLGYHIMASDGPIGSVENFLFDDQTWAIRYMVVGTREWLPRKYVLIAPAWIDEVSWTEREVVVGVTRKAVRTSPEYDGSGHVSRVLEADLYRYHERQG
jgi:sporulation protein YlmC with PRC-barrel domain